MTAESLHTYAWNRSTHVRIGNGREWKGMEIPNVRSVLTSPRRMVGTDLR
jgi:hypothetical protein